MSLALHGVELSVEFGSGACQGSLPNPAGSDLIEIPAQPRACAPLSQQFFRVFQPPDTDARPSCAGLVPGARLGTVGRDLCL